VRQTYTNFYQDVFILSLRNVGTWVCLPGCAASRAGCRHVGFIIAVIVIDVCIDLLNRRK
jgi:hypothetical protein